MTPHEPVGWRVTGVIYTANPRQPMGLLLNGLVRRVQRAAAEEFPGGVLLTRRLKAVPDRGLRRYTYTEFHAAPGPCACETCTGEASDLAGPHIHPPHDPWRRDG